MKGYRTIAFGLLLAIAPAALSYLAGIHWTDLVGPEWGGLIMGAIVILLRMVTTTPVGSNTSTIAKVLVAALALSLFLPRGAVAGDIANPANAYALKAPAVAPVNCTGTSCSGLFAMFGVTDYNGNFFNSLNNNATTDLGLSVGGGYQLWNSSWLAGLQGECGYEFVSQGASVPGSHATCNLSAHLGYNFFAGLTPSSSQPTTAGQNPFAGLVPTTLLQNATPYLSGGGCLRHGVLEGCAGIGIESALASSWSVAFDYTKVPTQKNQPDTNVFMLHLKKHFTLGAL